MACLTWFVGHILLTPDVEHLFMCFLVFSYSFCEKSTQIFLPIFKLGNLSFIEVFFFFFNVVFLIQ